MYVREITYTNKDGTRKGPYLYQYRSVREGKKVRSVYVAYLGKAPSRPIEELRYEYQEPVSNLSRSIALYDSGKSLICCDIETTGFSPANNKIIEISACKFHIENDKIAITGWSNQLIDPGVHIPYNISKLTGITDELVKSAPDIEEAYPIFRKFVKTKTNLGQNISFDMRFLNARAETQGYPVIPDNHQLDTMKLSRSLYPNADKHNLDAIAKREHIRPSGPGRHRAETDVTMTAEAWASMVLKSKYKLKEKKGSNENENSNIE
jgi:DNA polymerase-3 subunit alpha (Gram-positive type)